MPVTFHLNYKEDIKLQFANPFMILCFFRTQTRKQTNIWS